MASYAAALSTHPIPAAAAGEILGELTETLSTVPDLAVVFASGKRIDSLPEMVDAVHSLLLPHTLLAVSASGTLAGAEEVETGDSFSVWAGSVGDVTPIRMVMSAGSGAEPVLSGLPSSVAPGSVLMLLCDPFSFDPVRLTEVLETNYPGLSLAGGMVSASSEPGGNRLWLDDQEFSDGAVGVIFPPGVTTPIVSQGCRPIGRPWVITKGKGNLIRELGSEGAMTRLTETIDSLDPETREAAASGLLLGIVAADVADEPSTGDFLIRAVLGGDAKTEAIAVGAEIEVGQLVQFQVRDAASASHDLALSVTSTALGPTSALVFTCNGRGSHMFDEPNHDAQLFTEFLQGPVAGMFCAGEFGPVAGRNAVHTFTASALLFSD